MCPQVACLLKPSFFPTVVKSEVDVLLTSTCKQLSDPVGFQRTGRSLPLGWKDAESKNGNSTKQSNSLSDETKAQYFLAFVFPMKKMVKSGFRNGFTCF